MSLVRGLAHCFLGAWAGCERARRRGRAGALVCLSSLYWVLFDGGETPWGWMIGAPYPSQNPFKGKGKGSFTAWALW